MQNVLITGASGFIAQVLIRQLIQLPLKITALVRQPATLTVDKTLYLELTDSVWHSNPCEGIDTVFHLAGLAHELSGKITNHDKYHQVNYLATEKLLHAAQQAGVKRFIYLSSVKAVGDCENCSDESWSAPATTLYGQSKYAAEQRVLTENQIAHSVVIRPCMVYGNTDKGHLPQMIRAIAKGWFPPMPPIANRRSMIHVEDVARAMILAAQLPAAANQCYIVTDGQIYSTRELYQWICIALKLPIPRWYLPLKSLQFAALIADYLQLLIHYTLPFNSEKLTKLISNAEYSSNKIQTELGFQAQYQLKNSIAEIVAYLSKNKFIC
ncbi:MAG: hypothetical protein RL637_1132 [Pseudomonadota bacterium]|jgi:nucleoside-diphosphate-sugar epimerase